MKDLSQRCIFSGTSENLNTVMTITLDGEKYKVAVSDEYEDEASPGAIKKLIPKRLAEIEAAKAEMMSKLDMFKELAAELGFDLVKKGEAPPAAPDLGRRATPPDPDALADKPVVKINESTFKMQKNTRGQTKKDEAGLSREEAEAALEAAKRQANLSQGAPRPTSGEAPSYARHQIPNQVEVQTSRGVEVRERPQKGAQTMQTVKGRAGIPTAIPRNIHGTDGETTITIVDTGGDRTLQERGKQLNAMREYGDTSDYQKSCRPCQGTGLHAKKQCKTCGGTGIII